MSKKLHRLKTKRSRRAKRRATHYRKFLRDRRKKPLRARWHLVRFRRNKKAVEKLNRLIHKEHKRIAASRPKPGTGAWGGSESILLSEVIPLVERQRGPGKVGSGKRSETYGNPGSDHHVSQTTASARDFYLVNDYAMAREIYAALTGNSTSAWGGDYSNFYITRNGRRYRVQIIAGTHGTGPHLHAGVRRV